MISIRREIDSQSERTTGPGVIFALEQMKPLPPGIRLKVVLDGHCLCRCIFKEIGFASSGQEAAAMCKKLEAEGHEDITVLIGRF